MSIPDQAKETEARLADLRQELKNIHGTPCEVYSRVCGYLRPVQSWNKGKQEEFKLRAKFQAICGK